MHNAKIGNAKNLSRFEANISVYLSAAVVFVIALFWGGRQPFAVGLFDSPYDKIAHILAFSFPSLSLWFGVK
ncbi:MAG: hypothetical protein ACREDX_08550, partial [Aestuariivirga sp.]